MAEIPRWARRTWWLAALLGGGCAEAPRGWDTLAADADSTSAAVHDDEADTATDVGSSSEGTGENAPPDSGDAEETGDTGEPPGADDGAVPPLDEKRVRVQAGETKDAELVKTLPVAQSEAAAERRVVLRLSPAELPDLKVGDVLVTPAEVQVTTRCDVGQTAPGCGYDPKIRAQIVLTGDPDDTDPAGPESRALSDAQTQTCTKNEHHCMFVFRPSDATHTIEAGLPCVDAGDCRVNVVMWAWDGQARPDGQDEVIVGGNEGNYLDNGIVESDKARLMAVRERAITAGDRDERETTGGGNTSVNTNADAVLVYSHALAAGDGGLKAGEQFVVEAKIAATVGGRARFSTEMFLTKDPNATDGGNFEQTEPGPIGEHNGINCLPSQSPCVTRKVAVFRVTDDIAGPVHVNVVVKSAVPGGGSTSVTVHGGEGWVRSTRYDPHHEG